MLVPTAKGLADAINNPAQASLNNLNIFQALNDRFTGNYTYQRQQELNAQAYARELEARDSQLLSAAKQYEALGINPQALAGSSVQGVSSSSGTPPRTGEGFNDIIRLVSTLASTALGVANNAMRSSQLELSRSAFEYQRYKDSKDFAYNSYKDSVLFRHPSFYNKFKGF